MSEKIVEQGGNMIKVLLFAALCAVCYKTNPDEKSFKKYMEAKRKEKTSTTNSKVLNKMNNMISQAVAPLPNFTYNDYKVCSVCTIEDGPMFIGICNSWYPIGGGKSSKEQEQADAEAEKKIEQLVISGNKEKAQNNYNEAGKLYVKAAQGYEKERNTYEAACNYENAFKVYQSDENIGAASENAKKAARLFASQERTYSRAARIYESLAQLYKKQKDLKSAFENYTSAVNLYNKMDNNSGIQTRIAQANLAAEMGGYNTDKAIELFEDIAKRSVDEPLLKYNVVSSVAKASYLALSKCISKDNFSNFSSTLGKYIQAYPAFEDSPEYDLFHDVDLAITTSNPDKVNELCTKFKQTHSLAEWENEILDNAIKYADQKSVSIL
ncbi:TPR-like protein [Anaeromyces robustus]|jgi:tetratricopeptide (TPR) repeat protein|uniref:TPR-like protein n=1 Tax=Anaeromyces robustus TaxID=1754192 RepID=A0A1Y1XR99_9FUNG|nr:TPR-like protein [Anaeromyces robustus]|eukprot:ORX88282.1 TPR-like protein [Anaeromyces robustus]